MLREVSLSLEAETAVQKIGREHDVAITVLDCKNLNKEDIELLIDVSSPSRDAAKAIADLKAKRVFKTLQVGETGRRSSRALCLATIDRPGICQAVLDCGAFCLSCPYNKLDDGGNWRLLVGDSEQLNTLLEKLDELDIKASIGGLSKVKCEDRLTPRQREILAKAISLGYFEFPRKFGLTELSEQVGVKPSTLSQILRAAEEKVMAKYAAEMKLS